MRRITSSNDSKLKMAVCRTKSELESPEVFHWPTMPWPSDVEQRGRWWQEGEKHRLAPCVVTFHSHSPARPRAHLTSESQPISSLDLAAKSAPCSARRLS
jgi:hypothetical protein